MTDYELNDILKFKRFMCMLVFIQKLQKSKKKI
jgi:hypothetical protein